MSVLVAEQLHLDVARAHELALEIDGGIAERGAGLGSGGGHGAGELGRIGDGAHPLAAAARHRFDEERIADLGGRSGRASASDAAAGRGSSVPGTTGTPARVAAARAAVLLPISAIASGAGPMNVRPASRTAAANASFSARKP